MVLLPGFNINIHGGDNLYGRSQLKLRSENTEPIVLRIKLVTDIHNNLGLSTILANYTTVYTNNPMINGNTCHMIMIMILVYIYARMN